MFRDVFLSIISLLFFAAILEGGTRLLAALGAVRIESPMQTQAPEGGDWRWAHMTADAYREPDPLLFWRSAARFPFNAQRFKGPVVNVPKPAGVVRVFCYGDSNTEGPELGAWPERLQSRLEAGVGGMRYEIVNAGVAGYTSLQGLRRFREEVDRYRPDFVLVSFGWNDIAPALGGISDAAYGPPPQPLVWLERLLLHSDFYRLMKARLRRKKNPAPARTRARVPVEDYAENLKGFLETARRHGGRAVFLTRPHRADLGGMPPYWNQEVERYNGVVRNFAVAAGAPGIDVAKFFENDAAAFGDECHFSVAGHIRMAALVERELKSLLQAEAHSGYNSETVFPSRGVTQAAKGDRL